MNHKSKKSNSERLSKNIHGDTSKKVKFSKYQEEDNDDDYEDVKMNEEQDEMEDEDDDQENLKYEDSFDDEYGT